MALFRRDAHEPDEVIELRDPAPVEPPPPAAASEPTPGMPTACPECGGFGYLDHIDLTTRIQREHCKSCGLEWSWTWEQTRSSFFDDTHGIEIPGR